jgi:hypothetical protein
VRPAGVRVPEIGLNSIEHFPYTARRRWHIDVTHSNTTMESVDNSVDDRWRRADGAGLTRTLDAQGVCTENSDSDVVVMQSAEESM